MCNSWIDVTGCFIYLPRKENYIFHAVKKNIIYLNLKQACSELLGKGIHPTMIAEAFKQAAAKAEEILLGVAKPIDLLDRQSVLDAVETCLSSKVVHQNAEVLAPIAVDAVLGTSKLTPHVYTHLANLSQFKPF